MRIGIDARTILGRKTGDRSYALGLVHGLAALDCGHEFILYLDAPPPAGFPLGKGWQARVVRAPAPRLWTPLALPRAARADGVDVLHVQYIAPPCRRPAVVTTIHDVTFRLHPEWFPLKDRLLLDWGVRRSLRNVAAVITGSECTRGDLARVYGLAPERVWVTPYGAPPGCGPAAPPVEDVRCRHGLVGPYLLFVGVLQPRKNLPRIIRAFRAARRSHGFPHCLALAGKMGWRAGDMQRALGEPGAEADIRLIGYVPDEDLPGLMAGADLFLFPTLYEGFGLPVLEAFCAGTAVITSNVSALPEVTGEAAVLVNPEDEGEIAEAIGRLLGDPAAREALVEAGRERARQFTWERTAALTVACYEAALRQAREADGSANRR